MKFLRTATLVLNHLSAAAFGAGEKKSDQLVQQIGARKGLTASESRATTHAAVSRMHSSYHEIAPVCWAWGFITPPAPCSGNVRGIANRASAWRRLLP